MREKGNARTVQHNNVAKKRKQERIFFSFFSFCAHNSKPPPSYSILQTSLPTLCTTVQFYYSFAPPSHTEIKGEHLHRHHQQSGLFTGSGSSGSSNNNSNSSCKLRLGRTGDSKPSKESLLQIFWGREERRIEGRKNSGHS